MTLNQNIQTVAAAFANIDRIDPDSASYKKLCTILDQADDEALKVAYAAKIRFVSKLAFNRMIRRGLVPTV